VLYAKNCLISHTEEQLQFFTGSLQADLFGAGTSNQLPDPVNAGRKTEPTVYIYNDTGKLYCALAEQPKVISNSAATKP
jgi:hypothetical protein